MRVVGARRKEHKHLRSDVDADLAVAVPVADKSSYRDWDDMLDPLVLAVAGPHVVP